MFGEKYYRRYFRCSVCGKTNTAVKSIKHGTGRGHVKTFYCVWCKKVRIQYQVSK